MFCPTGSARPLPVHDGYYTIGGDEDHRNNEVKCESGFWCDDSATTRVSAGRYGATLGLNSSNCSGNLRERILLTTNICGSAPK